MDSRQQFEEWIAKQEWFDGCSLERGGLTDYIDSFTYSQWVAWQASRKSLVVELPTIDNKEWACTSAECESMRHGITMTKHKINAAGIRTK